MRVLDHRLEVRPPWAAGRIHIGGIGIAHGYWRDQTRTAERFIRHPSTGERLYWTGDLGRYWPDGTIEFLGREDRQVKIQGFRVEPGEVEAAIRSHPAVRECVVSAEEAPGGQRRLVALAVPHDGHRPDREAITAHLRSRLPHYMVPGQIHLVQRLPLTPNGKVDVARALATLAEPTTAAAGPARTEQGPFVRRLAALWAHLLQVPAVDPDADFFALGGNSLLALRLVNWVRTDLGLDLPFRLVFEAPTVRGLADHLEHGDGDSSTCAVTLATGTGTELFLFHPVGGAVSSYVSLARSWPGPVTAFESGGLTGGAAAADPDLETMAARYRAELQRRAPDGPYLLGGWSMGGVLAYEVGRQLAERGQPAHVFMLDSDVHNIRQPDTDLARNLEFLGDLAGGRLPAAVTRTLRSAAPDIPAALARDVAVQHRLLPAEIDAAGYARLLRVHAHNLAVLAGYRPARTDLPLLLILAGSVDRPDPVPAWRAACPSIEVDTWPCDHYSIVAGDRTQAITERVTAWLASTGRPVFQDGSHREDGIS
jgi:thioesterase domain-containing protein